MIGSRIGHFELVDLLGVGGMGEVYRARDTRLGREVAIKVLPEAFVDDRERLARFEREARVLASLNHPHVGAIYGLEQDGDRRVLVLELVEGETLAERIARGPLALPVALEVASQVADGLAAAHERGVIHRDLKPANVKVTPGGQVKVLDFGLAKALEATPAGVDAGESPTLTAQMTQAGTLLGTAAYMSPEQARGEEVDRRADVWAFGVLLFELVAGRRCFPGRTVTDTLAAVLATEPDWSSLPAGTPPAIHRLLRRCLAKDPQKRLRDLGDARLEIEETLAGSPVEAPSARITGWRGVARLGWLAVSLLAALGIGYVLARVGSPSVVDRGPTISRWMAPLPPDWELVIGGRSHPIALSADGQVIVYAAIAGRQQRLYVHRVGEFEPTELVGTEGARNPFFSPDGEWIGFFAQGQLKKVALRGGAPVVVCDSPLDSLGAAWSSRGTIYFATYGVGLSAAPAEGGEARVVAEVDYDRGETQFRWPQLLPGEENLLITVGGSGGSNVMVLDLTDGSRRMVRGVADASRGRYLKGGILVYGQPGGLTAAPFDLATARVTGNPSLVLPDVASVLTRANAYYEVAENGTLLYMPGGAVERSRLVWVDRNGRETDVLGEAAFYDYPRVSPDGSRILVNEGGEVGGRYLAVLDLTRGTWLPVGGGLSGSNAEWHPSQERVTFSSNREGEWDLYEAKVGAGDSGRVLFSRPREQWLGSWSPDGRYLAFYEIHPETARDIWIWDAVEGGEPWPYRVTAANERGPRFSRDGRWLAYISDESGRDEVYLESFPSGGQRWIVSTGGGAEPQWSRDGKRILYREGRSLYEVPIRFEPRVEIGTAVELFAGNYTGEVAGNPTWDISLDGERFLMAKRDEVWAPDRLHVVFGWTEELRRRLAGDPPVAPVAD